MRDPIQTTSPLIDFQIEDIWPILRKQRSIILLFLGTVLVVTLIGSVLRTKEYRATALIHLSPRAGQEVTVNEVVDFNTRGYFEIQQFYRTQIQVIMSRALREEVVRRYNDAGYDDLALEQAGADMLLGMLTVVPAEQSQLIDIHVEHTDPDRAAILANLLAEAYSDSILDSRRNASAGATSWLEEQLGEARNAMDEARGDVHTFMAQTNTADIEERIGTLQAELTALNEAHGERSAERVQKETALVQHRAMLNAGAYNELVKILNSPLLDAASKNYADAVTKGADVATRYGPRHPDRIQAEARIESLRQTLEQEVRRLIDGEAATVKALVATQESLLEQIGNVKQQMLDERVRRGEYDSLKNELDRRESFFDRLSERLQEVSLTAQTQLSNVQIVDRALPPKVPFKPNIPLNLAVACLTGLIGGVGLGLIREYLDDSITSQVDVLTHLKVPFLGLIPRLPPQESSQAADLFTHYNPRSSVAEAVRGLRAMLDMNPNGPPPRRLLVTSSIAREGKTSTTMRLAIAFAQMGRRVVVIDADLRRPRVHKIFNADNRVGLSSYLVGAASVDDIPQSTPVPKLSCIYSGALTDHPAELMASDAMVRLLDELEQRFDVVILDTPPSVALSDAVTLSRHVDGIVLVVKEQSVSRAVVKQTIDLMQKVDANLLGVVLNNVDLQRAGSKYKYYYAYRDYYANYEMPEGEGDGEEAAK